MYLDYIKPEFTTSGINIFFDKLARESILKLASNIEKKKLICLGTLFGKFTKGSQFRLHVTCLDFLAQFAQVHQS